MIWKRGKRRCGRACPVLDTPGSQRHASGAVGGMTQKLSALITSPFAFVPKAYQVFGLMVFLMK